jgi:hypothetical protein
VEVMKQQFKEWENEYKTSTMLPIPGAWRSAKSVINSAAKLDIPVTQEDNTPRGKTAVEKDIAAKKATAKEDKAPEDTLQHMLDTAHKYADKHCLNFHAFISTYL